MIRTELIKPVAQLLQQHAGERPAKTAYRDSRRSVSYGELNQHTARLAGHLQDAGLQPGQSVAILLPNSVEWVESCFAIVRAGGVAVPISHDATEPEIAYRIEDAACRAIIVSSGKAALVAALAGRYPQLKTVIVVGAEGGEPDAGLSYSQLLAGQPASSARDDDDIDATSFIIYTSGTTGRAKGVLLSQRGMLWVTAACWVPIAGLCESDHVLSPLPLFHSYALNLSVLSILAVGATETLLERFSTAEVMKQLQAGACTVLPGVPTMFHYLLEAARETPGAAFPGLRLCISAGAIMPGPINQEFERRFGVMLVDGYGITETSTMVTLNWREGTRVMGSCGLPVPGLAVRIVDLQGNDVPQGGEGELIVRGPNLMAGYHNKPAETEAALRNGWYHTGDLARADANGYLTITGRLKELIIRGGQNIAPAEVEEAVLAHPAVLDCAVVGAPHAHLGEVPVVFVVARPGQQLDRDALVEHCRGLISAYKLPDAVHLVEDIPRTGSGKIIRYKLKEKLQAQV